MTPTLYLWTLLGLAAIGGGVFFGLLRYRFDRKYGPARSSDAPQGMSAAE